MIKERLDKLLVESGLCDTRSQAQSLILAGKVQVNGVVVDKPGTLFPEDGSVSFVLEESLPYVSRGGLKLEKALQTFNILPEGKICIDIGASTGGFTDCLLQRGACLVYAVDVGYGQFDWRLRQDPRVKVFEKTNIRHFSPENLPEKAQLAVMDVSFISIKKVLPLIPTFLEPTGEIMALLKPQFEYKDYFHDKRFKGVVRGMDVHREIISKVLLDLSGLMPGWRLHNLSYSPITGPKGNVEFLCHFVLNASLSSSVEVLVNQVLTECYENLMVKES